MHTPAPVQITLSAPAPGPFGEIDSGILKVRAAAVPEGAPPARAVLDGDLDLPLGPRAELRYAVRPHVSPGDPAYSATWVAVDVELDDGTTLAASGATDARGVALTPAAQAAARHLVAGQWNLVRVPLGPVAGRRVRAIHLACSPPADAELDLAAVEVVDSFAADDARSLVDRVETRRGTHSDGSFSRGNTVPAVARPNGFQLVVPMTDATTDRWLYEWGPAGGLALQGIGVSHIPSPWMGDRNQLAIMPVPLPGPDARASDVPREPGARALPFSHAEEEARAHLYRVRLHPDSGDALDVAVTSAERALVLRTTLPAAGGAVVLDLVRGDGELRIAADGTVSGWVDGGSRLSAGRSRMFVAGSFDTAPDDVAGTDDAQPGSAVASFSAPVVELRLATSFLGAEQAAANLTEVSGSFDDVASATRAAWAQRLGGWSVEGASDDELTTLASNLYRLHLYPNAHHEPVETGGSPAPWHASPVLDGAPAVPGELYVNNGFWDTYRTAWPAYALLEPTRAARLVDGFVQQYREGGWVARWSSPGYADLMTGTSSDAAFADAVLKGVTVPDLPALYAAALRNATVVPPSPGVGRKGLATSAFRGYVDRRTPESVSWALESYLNDDAIARLADHLAEHASDALERRRLADEAAYLRTRAAEYVTLFDAGTGFFRGRSVGGAFDPADDPAFDPRTWGGDYTETNAWTHLFGVPHDVAGLAALLGGRTAFLERLGEFLGTPETGDTPGHYSGVIHEMVEAREVRLGQLGMSNQPAHHIPYLWAAAGDPATTQRLVREILDRLFVGSEIGQGYLGDEDNGEMSAWWLFSALGFYPMQVGAPVYVIGSPLFRSARVRLPGGDLVVDAPENSRENVYVQSLRVNGVEQADAWIAHDVLAAGAHLEFEMGPTPSAWGTPEAGATLPPSLTPWGSTPAARVDLTRDAVVTCGGEKVPWLVDDDATSDGELRGAVEVALAAPAVVGAYTLTSASDEAADPASWVLEGATDDGIWRVLDARDGEGFPWRRQVRPFGVATPGGPVARVRLRVLATAGGAAPRLAELELTAG
ncbi:alpha-1,2-mannosidase [Beutenbergia cavernae DSM 12333]|uniref:Alpha-1,2-mannosidase n=1 Tax=Beutenbergia cavernae (strain ATCC BAA-8 / DSM 12333 / CCUG 43141 / JCM 11478 / NBRC 16432 / NCIMB 13614 / HKI 0122) TaxID=471853 RepID=C5BZR8_BEUC1|nr:alpha-1,2-mannosidase [Beutenbergia cavernae DSM 12333]